MFIEKAYGKDTIVKIVRECEDGDVLAALGEDPDPSEKRWQEWLLQEDGEF